MIVSKFCKYLFQCSKFSLWTTCRNVFTEYEKRALVGKGSTFDSYAGRNSDVNFGDSIVPVKMAYSSYESTTLAAGSNNKPVVIMHGLLGSKSNWNSLSKAIHNKTKLKVIAVDARNHGESPHTPEFSYNHLAADVKALITDLSLSKAMLVGHSMGGRTMMLFSLRYPELVGKLVIVDISPLGTSPSLKHMIKYFDAMRQIHVEPKTALSAARKSVDTQLSKFISDPGLRQFLITNLVESDTGTYKWRVNLDAISNNFTNNISNFPNVSSSYTGPTLFIGGTNSDYLKKEEEEGIKKLFPKAEFAYIQNAGHWVHAEKPQEFLDVLIPFLTRTS